MYTNKFTLFSLVIRLMFRNVPRCVYCAIAILWAVVLYAQPTTVNWIFSSGMVLQAGKLIVVWGTGKEGTAVSVEFAGKTRTTKVTNQGEWSVQFPQKSASYTTYKMVVSAEGRKIAAFDNILIGEVWLCIGQTNMTFPLKSESHFATEFANFKKKHIRIYNPVHLGKDKPLRKELPLTVKQQLVHGPFYQGVWEEPTPSNLDNMPALPYYFASYLSEHLSTPIGIINLAINGSPIEAWLNPVTLQNTKKYSSKIKGLWLQNGNLPFWARRIGSYQLYGTPNLPAGLSTTYTDHPFKPGYVWKHGIQPLAHLAIRGVVTYQGETNVETAKRAQEYTALFGLQVSDYRRLWKNEKLMFYFVQFPSIESESYRNAEYWPEFRDLQRVFAASTPYVEIAPSYDIGDNSPIPREKKLIANRLGALACAKTYKKQTEVEAPRAPVPIGVKMTADGLLIKFINVGAGLTTKGDINIHGFSVDHAKDVRASLYSSSQVIVEVNPKPRFVYYAFGKNVTHANLVNSSGVPALSFKLKVF